jgi:hypothetical protein
MDTICNRQIRFGADSLLAHIPENLTPEVFTRLTFDVD